MLKQLEGTIDPNAVLGAHQAMEDAWWILHAVHVEDWQGPGSIRAEEGRLALMLRVADLRDQMGELHTLTVTLAELENLLAMESSNE